MSSKIVLEGDTVRLRPLTESYYFEGRNLDSIRMSNLDAAEVPIGDESIDEWEAECPAFRPELWNPRSGN